MVGVITGGTAGAAAGTMVGKGVDSLFTSYPSSSSPKAAPSFEQATTIYGLVAQGVKEAKKEMKRLNAIDLAASKASMATSKAYMLTAWVNQGKTHGEIEKIMKFL